MTKTVKILHTADIHLGAKETFLGKNAPHRRFETLSTFEKIIDLAISENVDIIALAGDIFHSNRVEEQFIKAVFEKIASAAPIKVVYAAGNHDPLNSESPFKTRTLPENLYVLGVEDECLTFEDISLRVYGRSFASADLSGEDIFKITDISNDYVNLMVQHGELSSSLNSNYNPITPRFVKNSGMDYIALGHIHKKSDIGRIDNTFFAYCGCPEGQGFDELDDKGVYIGEIGKNTCNLQFVSISKRKHIHEKVDVSNCSDSGKITETVLEKLSGAYGENFRDNLYKIELTGEIDPETEIVCAEIESRLSTEVYFAKVKDSTEYYVNPEELSKEITLKGIFVKKMLEKEAEATEEQKPIIRKALNLGLKAFIGEVNYNED